MPRGKPAQRKRGFKEKMKDKQIRPSLDKDKVVPEEKKYTEEQKKIFIQRFGYDPTK